MNFIILHLYSRMLKKISALILELKYIKYLVNWRYDVSRWGIHIYLIATTTFSHFSKDMFPIPKLDNVLDPISCRLQKMSTLNIFYYDKSRSFHCEVRFQYIQ